MRRNLERLKEHSWPGNVRELKNVVQRAFILASDDIGVDALPLGVVEERSARTSPFAWGRRSRRPSKEKKAIEDLACYLVRALLSLHKLVYLDARKPCCIDPG
jgi:DNA-binding NtrC family response regulator